LNEHKDARETKRLVEAQGRKCVLIAGDIGQEKFCRSAVVETKREIGAIDILVNNAAEQHPQESITKITEKQLEKLFGPIFSRCFSHESSHATSQERRRDYQHGVGYRVPRQPKVARLFRDKGRDHGA
jgi:NAD(P)-dependent dehydrogenase (short-subunit alcohol dehydrogenase family)